MAGIGGATVGRQSEGPFFSGKGLCHLVVCPQIIDEANHFCVVSARHQKYIF